MEDSSIYTIYTTNMAIGKGENLPTPIEVELTQDGDRTNLKIKGTDGQQVTEAVLITLSKAYRKNTDTGLREFVIAISVFSLVFVLGVVALTPKPPETKPLNQPSTTETK